MDLLLSGKYALVTGGSHGIGRAVALALTAEGCHVAICARDAERISAVVDELNASGPNALGVPADATDSDDIDRVFATISEKWGRLHILINNVGGGGRWGLADVIATEESVWNEVYDKNARSAIRFTRLAVPYMMKEQWGRVITITSTLGKQGGGRPWFNMAKCAQTAMMKSLAMNAELVRSGITFNSVAPGCIMIPETGWDKEMQRDPQAFHEMVDKTFPLGRLGTPEEVAAIVTFLCSPHASLVNGASILVDGGESSCL